MGDFTDPPFYELFEQIISVEENARVYRGKFWRITNLWIF
jgi:hypothetical protein